MSLRILLLPFSILYGIVVVFRNLLFDLNILKVHSFDVPIILVGNLSTGGTGKTPHVEYLIRLLSSKYRIAILSRGYGRITKGFVIADNNSTTEDVGDEPLQIYRKFENITVSVCEDRVNGIEKLLNLKNPPDIILMDDGFQHRYVQPGWSILLTANDKLFTEDFLLPAGNLREPRWGYKRADTIIVTKCDPNMSSDRETQIHVDIHPIGRQQLFFSHFKYDSLIHFFSKSEMPLHDLKSFHVLLITGVAHPERILKSIKKECKSVTHVHFSDHHRFSIEEVKSLKEKFDKFAPGKNLILTTEKDYQRLKEPPLSDLLKDLPVYYLPVSVAFNNQEEFNNLIFDYVAKNKRNR